MMNLEKLAVIAKAKFSNKDNLGEWYKTRLEICEQCPLNSKNKERLTLRDKAWVAANLGKDTCLACGCGIEAKASLETSVCGLVKLNKSPLWKAIDTGKSPSMKGITVTNATPEVADLIEYDGITLDYGERKMNSDFKIELIFKDPSRKLKSIDVKSGCSCTDTVIEQKDFQFKVTIEYKRRAKGAIVKGVSFILDRGGIPIQIKGKLIGTIN